jgi:predicted N-acyltransferase
MRFELVSSLAQIEPQRWDTLVGDGLPFLEWGWLASLELAGCVTPQTGWLPQHLTAWDGNDLVAACPLYLKSHSQGEFVFDHGWAEAAHHAGIAYYPKLLAAVPFTPAAGARFLTHPEVERPATLRLLAGALRALCERGFSSAHVNFCLADEIEALEALGFMRRTGYQFQWHNSGWRSFDDFLGALRSKRRVQIKREQRELEAQGIAITVHSGSDIPEDLFPTMFRLYKSTIDKLYWGRQYLNQRFFDLLRQNWKPRLCFMVARRSGSVVAGSVCVRKGAALYGRYWGCFEEWRYLHFNVCYYAPIAHCLESGATRFEPGAGGEFKHLRGFDAHPTHSMHFVRDPGLGRAVADYLRRERPAVANEIEWLGEQSALRRQGS